MLTRIIAAIAIAAACSAPFKALAQQTGSMPGMPGMPGMKDSVSHRSKAKAKPPAHRTKRTARKKAAASHVARGSSKARPSRRAAPVKPATPMSMPMDMPMHAHDSVRAMGSPTRKDSSNAMQMPMTGHDSSGMSTSRHDSAGMSMGRDSARMPMPAHDSSAMQGMRGMTAMAGMKPMTADEMMIGPLGISMERMGSGTTWIPDAVTMPSRRTMMGSWMVMAHGFAFAQYDHQSGTRGDNQFGSLNWAMLMATKNVAGGRFQARTMLSLDALGVTSRGYPLLLQTGESFDGVPLHDRQHPHDFFMELGALYQRQFSPSLGWSIYAAPSGEPALGPVAFMHRPSAMDNPSAPIAHHWQDATHVSFGVLTGGLFTKSFQVEASAFNGREPDQHRWNFDPIRIDSYSSRVTFNPSSKWSMSGGYGYIKSPEALNPKMSMHRLTASLLNGRRIGDDGQISSAFIWGANKHSDEPGLSHSFLAESEAILDRRSTFLGRTEWVEKSAEDLVADVGSAGLPKGVSGFSPSRRFTVGMAQLGYIREMARTHWATVGLGAAGTINFVPSALERIYGSRTPLGLFVFLRLRPFHERNAAMGTMDMHTHE